MTFNFKKKKKKYAEGLICSNCMEAAKMAKYRSTEDIFFNRIVHLFVLNPFECQGDIYVIMIWALPIKRQV